MKIWKNVAIGMTLGMLVAGIPALAYADDAIVEDDVLIDAEDDIETVLDLGTNEDDIDTASDLEADEDIFDDSMFAAEDESVTDISGLIIDTDELQAAGDVVNSGTCGEHLTWTLDSKGELTISGTGEMTDFSYEVDEEEDEGPVSPFKQRTDIKSIVISYGVTSVGSYAFPGCSNLESVTFPGSLTKIEYNSFENCTSLTSITIPDSVTYIGNGSFGECSNLKSVTLPAKVLDIGAFTFYGCSSLTSITIPDGVTFIGPLAFYECSSLKSISIPDSVTKIWEAAFNGCSDLESIMIPNSYTEFDEGVFGNCPKLTIYGNAGSSAETYANENSIPFEILVICDHTYNEWSVTTPPTCTESGVKTRTCSSCGKTETEIIPATGHNVVIDAAKSATITSTGLTEGSHCSVCGTILVAQKTIPRLTPPQPVEIITVTKKPTIKNPAAAKGKITVNWKHFKQTKKTKSIWKKIKKVQVQCATDKGFANIVKSTMVGKKKTKAAIKGLAKKTTYYVRVRYYDGTGYSAWSKVKKVKTK